MPELLSSATDSPASLAPASFSPPSRRWKRPALPVGGCLLAVTATVAGADAGFWFVPFVAGLVFGLSARHRRLRLVLPAAVMIEVTGWAIPLMWQALHGAPVAATARVVAALTGLPASGALVLGATLLIAAIQALTGVWLARAIRRLATA